MKKNLLTIISLMAAGGLSSASGAIDSPLTIESRALWGSICNTSNATTGNYSGTIGKMLVCWRMLPGDDENTAFDLYRTSAGAKEVKVNKEPIFATNFQDLNASSRAGITYRLTYAGQDETIATYTIAGPQLNAGLPYISIPLKETTSVCDIEGIRYEANDVSVGDLDGDGEMEIVVKRLLAHDALPARDGYPAIEASDGTGGGQSPKYVKHTLLYEAYKLDGTMLWRIGSGPNILLGNSSSFAIDDFDGDGCAEMAIKTGEGTVFGDGEEIGDIDGDGKTDYRTIGANYIGEGPEFFSIVDGKTGAELARANFITRGKSEDWGDNYFKRASSLRVGVAYIDGKLPSVILGRGVYARSVIEAWSFRDGELNRQWQFDTRESTKKGKDGQSYSKYAAQGFHSLSTGDVDGDGFDEIVYGSMTVDHDGVGLYSSNLGHGDALHLGKFDKSRDGLQIYTCHETGKTDVALRNAADGSIIYTHLSPTDGDMGRAMIDDIDPNNPGCELWWYRSSIYSTSGTELGGYPGSTNFAIWFDGTLSRQVYTGDKIDNYRKGRVFTIYRFDMSYINGTKENPSFYGDILGDWREEIIFPDVTKTKNLKIFTSWMPTEHRFPWLMTDHIYRMSALNQNIGYNQPTHTGYYLGSDAKSDSEIWKAAGYINDESGVESLESERISDGIIYDLTGRRVENPVPGIYIRDGKKFIVR